MLSVTRETRGRVLESLFQSRKVDPDESNDLGTIGTPTQTRNVATLGEPDAVKAASPVRRGTVGKGPYSVVKI